MAAFKTLDDYDLTGKRVLLRADLNVPVADGKVTDATRIERLLPTIREIVKKDAKVIILSHFGRPKGKVDPEFSLEQVVPAIVELTGHPVGFIPTDWVDVSKVKEAIDEAPAGSVLVLENTRFHKGEEENDAELAKRMASLGDIYVNDAFSAAHRAHASTEGVAHFLPAVAGLLMERELVALAGTLENPARPFVTIIGGAKISDKIGVIENLLAKVDALLIGGGMANTFLLAQGYDMGDSLVEVASIDLAKRMLELAHSRGAKLLLPSDAVVADKFAPDATNKVVAITQVASGWRILDIGPDTRARYAAEIATAKTVIWNGPMGVFEMPAFAEGTRAVAQALADSSANTVIGGGDSVAAIEQMGLADKVSHISTGGGASLELLEGRILPGVAALADRK